MSKHLPKPVIASAVAAGLILFPAVTGCGSQDTGTTSPPAATTSAQASIQPATSASQAATGAAAPTSTTLSSGLKIEDEVVGTGPAAKSGDTVTVNYTGWLTSGKKFDASADHGQPFTFTLGQGQVITGWDQGVAGMKAGGKRKLTIPPELGYGAQGAGGVIPPNATLIFEVELVKIG